MFRYVLSLTFAVAFATATPIVVSLGSNPRAKLDDSATFDTKSVTETNSLAPLSLSSLASVSAAGGTGQVFQNIGITFLNQNNGTINYNDGWSFVNAPSLSAQMSNPDPACQGGCNSVVSFYEFTLDNPGSVTVNWSSSSFGSNTLGIGGIDITFDPPPHAMFTNLFVTGNSGNGSFANNLTAGTHTIAFLDGSGVGIGATSTLNAHLVETLTFSIAGTVEPPSPVPEPSTVSLLVVGLIFFLSLPIRRIRLLGRFNGWPLRRSE